MLPIVLLACWSGASFAELPVRIEDYVRRALASNPGPAAAEQRYMAARAMIPRAASLPDPMLQATYMVEEVQTRTGPQETLLSLNQKIPWFGTLGRREDAAAADAEALRFAYRYRQIDLIRQTSMAFYEYAWLEDAIRLTDENAGLLQKLEPVVEEKVRTGADLNALLRLKVEIGSALDRLQSLRQQKLTQNARLVELLALPPDTRLPPPLLDPPESLRVADEAMGEAVIEENPELQMLRRSVTGAEARRRLAGLERYPDLQVGANYILIGEPDTAVKPPDAGQDAWGITVGISIPLWFGRNRAAVAEAIAREEATGFDYRSRRNALLSDLAAARNALADAVRRLNVYGNDLLGLADQAVANSRSAYEGGKAGILDVIDSERTRLDLQLQYRRAVIDAMRQRVIIETLSGRGPGLEEP